MAQIPIVSGIYTSEDADFRSAYPVNLIPVPKAQGISEGYLRPADGIVAFGEGPGTDRGGINWRGTCYRVMGTKLVSISDTGTVTVLGDVGIGGNVSFDYSFDRLAIASGEKLYYWDGATLTHVTDPELGVVLDVIWVDGYFMTTDGEFLVVTELTDPTAVDPLKYGSSEVDPDPVKALLKLRNEVHALNRYTIEIFDNVGGQLFPFQRIEGAQMKKGVIGTHGACIFEEAIAFLGSGRNESPAIHIGTNSQTRKISSREIDQLLLEYTEEQLELVVLEAKVDKGHQHLYVHLPDRTVVFDSAASNELGVPVWFTLTTAISGFYQYRAKNFVWCYDRWLCGDPASSAHGYLVDNISSHYGQAVRWEFGTTIVYGGGKGALFKELELVCLTGRVAFGADPTISSAYSIDGESWSQEHYLRAGKTGNRTKRLVWFQHGWMRNWRLQRFSGTSDAFLSFARLEAQLEPLVY